MNSVLILNIILHLLQSGTVQVKSEYRYRELTDHTMVTDNGVFPFVAAILFKSVYISAGALINEFWVITAADSLYLVRESTRVMRVRLGSVNNKKGGQLHPVKTIEIHPNFDDNKPQFDIALVLLPRRVRFTPTLSPIKLQMFPKKAAATHFLVNSWPPHVIPSSVYPNHTESLDNVKRRRMMTVSHLHPSSQVNCSDVYQYMNLSAGTSMLCLDPALGTDPCERDVGAPVVLNGVLWGILSSWKSEDCDVDPSPILVTLVSARNISSWIYTTTREQRRNFTRTDKAQVEYEDYYYDEDDDINNY